SDLAARGGPLSRPSTRSAALRGRVTAVTALSLLGTAAAAPRAHRDLSLHLADSPRHYASAPALTRPLRDAPIRNFGVVTPGCIYRSGQPSTAGFRWLKGQGFKSIVCLRKEHDDGAAEMAKYGFHYLYLPIVDETAPTKEQAESFLKFAADRENWPLLVHCHGGEGRAATMSALVRYSFHPWERSVALKEARNYRALAMIRGQLCASQRRFLDEWTRTHAPGTLRPQVGSTPTSQPGEDH